MNAWYVPRLCQPKGLLVIRKLLTPTDAVVTEAHTTTAYTFLSRSFSLRSLSPSLLLLHYTLVCKCDSNQQLNHPTQLLHTQWSTIFLVSFFVFSSQSLIQVDFENIFKCQPLCPTHADISIRIRIFSHCSLHHSVTSSSATEGEKFSSRKKRPTQSSVKHVRAN